MQSLIISGKLPSTKDECATLAALNLRIYELSYIRMMEEEEERRRMKMAAAAAKKSKDTMGSFRVGGGTTQGGGGGAGGDATRGDVSHDDEISNTNTNFANRSNNAIQEEEEDEQQLHANENNQVTTTTKTTTIEVIKKKRSSSSAASKPLVIVGKDGASVVNLAQPRDSLISTQSATLIMPVIVSNGCESMLIYLRSCSCFSTYAAARIVSVGQLVSPNYQRSNDMLKLIKVFNIHTLMIDFNTTNFTYYIFNLFMLQIKKDKLSKTSYYNNELKLKEQYVKMCRNLNCFGCVLFTVKEIVYETNTNTNVVTFKKVKRLLAIKPNKISLIDAKTKALVTSQRMTDLKSWYSGDGYYNLTPIFLLNSTSSPFVQQQQPPFMSAHASSSSSSPHTNPAVSFLAHLFRLTNANSRIDINKLFVIEFRTCKWHLQIDDFHSLKSITCILLDQSLDMGIDSNPLMLDLTISEHFQNRLEYKIFIIIITVVFTIFVKAVFLAIFFN